MQKKVPERTCIVCRKKGEKENFIKIVCNKNNEIHVEKDKKLDGRGAYICKNPECIKKCIKQKSLSRVFKRNVDESVYEEFENEFSAKQN